MLAAADLVVFSVERDAGCECSDAPTVTSDRPLVERRQQVKCSFHCFGSESCVASDRLGGDWTLSVPTKCTLGRDGRSRCLRSPTMAVAPLMGVARLDRFVLLLAACPAGVSCAREPARTAVDADHAMVSQCTFVGHFLHELPRHGSWPQNAEGPRNEVRRRAAEAGATHLVWDAPVAGRGQPQIVGLAYSCPSAVTR